MSLSPKQQAIIDSFKQLEKAMGQFYGHYKLRMVLDESERYRLVSQFYDCNSKDFATVRLSLSGGIGIITGKHINDTDYSYFLDIGGMILPESDETTHKLLQMLVEDEPLYKIKKALAPKDVYSLQE